MKEHDELAWHLIDSLPAFERGHCIELVGQSRGYPLALGDAPIPQRVADPVVVDLNT